MRCFGDFLLRFSAALGGSALIVATAIAQMQSPPEPTIKPRSRVSFTHPLPGHNGDRLTATIVEVNYGPGESSRPHSHGCSAIGYVLSGTIRTQVKGENELLIHPGGSFYEAAHGVHIVSANASKTEPASFLAFLVCDGDQPLSTDVPSVSAAGGQ